ncbi:MAG: hypothetical protein HYZ26_13260 [Chloroflexi bacterium]|nr:hypothetical protein [Chloroflexota bacterium]
MNPTESFRINIYAVGRSGTKAAQLWLAYLLARRYGAVWVNYEPLRYRSRKLEASYYGWRVHTRTPQLLETTDTPSGEFRAFCRMLAEYPVNVTKFIRANGRINAINAVMQPDLSILIVRDLYQVLESVARLTWSLVPDEADWARLCAAGRGRYPFLDPHLKPGQESKLLVNAAHWFLHNMHALEHAVDTLAVPYDRLDLVEAIARQRGLESHGTSLRHPAFRGGIHGDVVLEDVHASKGDPLKAILPGRLYRQWAARYARERSGGLCRAVETLPEPEPKDRGQTLRVQVPRHPVLDDLNLRVQEKLAEVVARQQIG